MVYLPVSMGNCFGSAPEPRKISVSTIPGWTEQMKISGFSAARNSRTFICANFELRYPDRYGVCLTGSANAPAVMAYKAASDFAVGTKACEEMTMDLTLVLHPFSGIHPCCLNTDLIILPVLV